VPCRSPLKWSILHVLRYGQPRGAHQFKYGVGEGHLLADAHALDDPLELIHILGWELTELGEGLRQRIAAAIADEIQVRLEGVPDGILRYERFEMFPAGIAYGLRIIDVGECGDF
jgi:hypothetical protein